MNRMYQIVLIDCLEPNVNNFEKELNKLVKKTQNKAVVGVYEPRDVNSVDSEKLSSHESESIPTKDKPKIKIPILFTEKSEKSPESDLHKE